VKKLGAGILLLLICSTISSKWLLIAGFQLNQRFIATTLCINKNKPGNTCAGRCYLCKQLNREENGSKTGLPASKDNTEVQLFCQEPGRMTAPPLIASALHHPAHPRFCAQEVYSQCFRPPQQA